MSIVDYLQWMALATHDPIKAIDERILFLIMSKLQSLAELSPQAAQKIPKIVSWQLRTIRQSPEIS